MDDVQLGIWLFIASEVMLFGGLFSAYFMLRAGAASPWLPLRDHLGGALTATLALLAATAFVAASRGLRRYRLKLTAAAALALAFCALKAGDYRHLLDAHRDPASSTQMATYFLLTGVHLLHVAGGVIAIAWAAWRSGAAPEPRAAGGRLRALTRYWMFVDAIWLLILVLLYVV